jgi:hypothetical protein
VVEFPLTIDKYVRTNVWETGPMPSGMMKIKLFGSIAASVACAKEMAVRIVEVRIFDNRRQALFK